MSASFLRIDLDQFGISAMLVEQTAKNAMPREECHVLFKDLPESKESQDSFDAGLDIISQQIDLSSCSTAVIFVSSLSVFFRNMELPFRSEKKISQVLPFELESFLPYADENYISDFHRIGIDDNSNLILTASFLESQIKKYVSKLDDLGIKPVIITPGGYASVLSFLKERKELSSFIFLHRTKSETTLVIVVNRKPCMVRAFSALQSGPGKLAAAVRQSILGFRQRTGIDPVFNVFIYSDGDNQETKEICSALDHHLENPSRLRSVEIPCERIQENVSSKSLLSAITPETQMKYLFNFCKGKYGAYSFLKTYLNHLATGFGMALILFSLSVFSINTDISGLDEKIDRLDKTALRIYRETFPDKTKVMDPYLEMTANVKAALKKSGTAYNNHDLSKKKDVRVSDVILELSKRIAASIDVDASRLIFNEGRLILSGSTDNFNNVDKVKTGIEGSKMFEKVSISSAAMDKKGNRVNFKFIIEM